MDQCVRGKLFIIIKRCIFFLSYIGPGRGAKSSGMNQLAPVLLLSRWLDLHGFPPPGPLCCDAAARWLAPPPHTKKVSLRIPTENLWVWSLTWVCVGSRYAPCWTILRLTNNEFIFFSFSVCLSVSTPAIKCCDACYRLSPDWSVSMTQSAAAGLALAAVSLPLRCMQRWSKYFNRCNKCLGSQSGFCWNTPQLTLLPGSFPRKHPC